MSARLLNELGVARHIPDDSCGRIDGKRAEPHCNQRPGSICRERFSVPSKPADLWFAHPTPESALLSRRRAVSPLRQCRSVGSPYWGQVDRIATYQTLPVTPTWPQNSRMNPLYGADKSNTHH